MPSGILSQHIQDGMIKLQMFDEDFLKLTRSVIEPRHFTADETQRLCKINYSFFDRYKTCPKDHLWEEIRKYLEGKDARDAEVEIYVNYLESLEEFKPNKEYILSEITKFVRRSNLRDAAIQFAELVTEEKFDVAEELMYKALKSGIVAVDTGLEYMTEEDMRLRRLEEQQYLMTTGIPGLDELIGGLERKTLVTMVAPPKGTKSWSLVHLAAEALMQGLNVVYLSHEMAAEKILDRLDQNLFKVAKDRRRERIKHRVNIETDEEGHQVGTIEPYSPTQYKLLTDVGLIGRNLKSARRFWGRLFVKDYPTGSCTVMEARRYLDYLEVFKDFVPDVFISDYGDIMAPDRTFDDAKENLNSIWVGLRGIAVERNILALTASQSQRQTMDARRVYSRNVAGEIRKVAISDLIITIAATESQAREGIRVIRVASSRDEEQQRTFPIVSDLDFGQWFAQEIPRSMVNEPEE